MLGLGIGDGGGLETLPWAGTFGTSATGGAGLGPSGDMDDGVAGNVLVTAAGLVSVFTSVLLFGTLGS